MTTLNKTILKKVQELELKFPQDIVVVYDSRGIYQYVSSNRQQSMGYTPQETYGRHYREFVAPDYMDQVKLTWNDTHLTGQSIVSTVLLRKKSGELARFRTIAWSVADPQSGEDYMIVKSQPLLQE